MPHAAIAYPSLRLAARALPRAMAGVNVAALERIVPRRLAGWATAVPLDAHCGLTRGRPPDRQSSLGARWERWRPLRWRLAVAYGDVALPLALWRHVALIGRRVGGRCKAVPAEVGALTSPSRSVAGGVVEMRGLEPLTPAMRTRCSPS